MDKSVREKCFEADSKAFEEFKTKLAERQEKGESPREYAMPIGLQFELTGRCNLFCKHCYNNSGADALTTMTPDDWRKLARDLVAAGGIFECVMSGGEPLLLGDDLISIMDILHDDGTSFVLITNGLLLDDAWIAKLKKYRYFFFQVSIDGPTAELHDPFRGLKGSFDRAVAGAFKASLAGLPVRIAHTVSKTTLPYMDDMAKLAYGIGATSLSLGEALPSGRTFKHTDETTFTDDDNKKLYDSIERLTKEYAGRMLISRSAFLKVQESRYRAEPTGVLIVRPDGNLRLDCMAPFVIGNVKERPFMDIWREKAANAWQHPKVSEFIEKIEGSNNWSDMIHNYSDEDIRL